jgi:hypothetical protein
MRAMIRLLVPALALAAAPLAAQAPGEDSAVRVPACDRACLIGFLQGHMQALAARDPAKARLASTVRFTENNVVLPVGDGLWDTVTGVDATGLEAADPSTGNAAWFGSVKENGRPAIYAVRIHVKDGAIDEIESVVHRRTALPAPFGDVTAMVHDPEFNAVLPPEQRRPRERMLSIADAYFDTVQLNDGQVFAPFAEDCGRLENGISTTAPPPGGGGGNAAAIASGCRAQFELGLYKINKRIRRDFFIIDEERGVAVGRGFFDHANEWDHYLLTNGREMKTALKWPNTISPARGVPHPQRRDRADRGGVHLRAVLHAQPVLGPRRRATARRARSARLRRRLRRGQRQRGDGSLPGARPVGLAAMGRQGRLRREQRRHPRQRGHLAGRHRNRRRAAGDRRRDDRQGRVDRPDRGARPAVVGGDHGDQQRPPDFRHRRADPPQGVRSAVCRARRRPGPTMSSRKPSAPAARR